MTNASKSVMVMMVLLSLASVLFGQDIWDRIDVVFGPRVGFTYEMIDPADFTSALNQVPMFDRESYFPLTSQFGLSFEQRILLGSTKSHFVFEEVILVGGIDQSIAIPTAAILLGYRSEFGLELGLGPVWSLGGLSVAYSIGWTFEFSDVYVPLNIVVIPDFNTGHHNLSIFTGFNFNVE